MNFEMKVLLIYDKLIPSVRLCAYNPLAYLAKADKIKLNCRQRLQLTRKDLAAADIVFFVRADSCIEEAISERMKKKGIPSVYVLDDDLLNVPENLSSSVHYGKKSTQRYIKNIMQACSIFLSPSLRLVQKYGAAFKRTLVIAEAMGVYPVISKNEYPLKIGFAGTVDREDDFKTGLNEAIAQILEKYPEKVQFEFLGAKPEVVDKYDLTWYPYQDSYQLYVQKIQELAWDIGLAPMSDTEFHRCKYYNKYLEYGAYGIVGIFAAVEPYLSKIEENQTGFLAENTCQGWFDKIAFCLEHRERLEKIRRQIRQDIAENYSLGNIANQLYQMLKAVHKDERHKKNVVTMFFLPRVKFQYLAEKTVGFIRRNGVRSFSKIIKKVMKWGRDG